MSSIPNVDPFPGASDAESRRLADDAARHANWKRWGPYLAERQWGTVREDYSPDGSVWTSFPHDHARSRAYRWGEDGLLGICDRECRLCFSIALWNGKDSILKERLFGLSGIEGNHGEDVKEHYFYLDSTPTHSYMKALYKYAHAAFPYERLITENRERSRSDREFEISDTGIFDENRYFDATIEYAKAASDDICVRVTIANRGPEAAPAHLLPTLWFRNTWSWGSEDEAAGDGRPILRQVEPGRIEATHPTLGVFTLDAEPADGRVPELLFTENETNYERVFGMQGASRYAKDAFHARVVNSDTASVNPARAGTKAAAWYSWTIPASGSVTIRLRLREAKRGVRAGTAFGAEFDRVFDDRKREADEFYEARGHEDVSPAARGIARQAAAGLLWSKQFYHYIVPRWLEGDPLQPKPAESRLHGRNCDWTHVYNRDVISMPDAWEYPWYAAWDLAFQVVPFAQIDPTFAKEQLLLFLREWYMHPSGQLPAYEFALGDVNPPVHAWACWRVYKMTGQRGARDRVFLTRCFQKLLLNFTWWVNRKDPSGKHLFAGGFLGLDNIGVFDRSQPLPTGGQLEQADGTAWMAFYCGTMLSIALELAKEDQAYEDMASKFFEHFVAITDAMNTLGGTGLWDEEDGFYYDQIKLAEGKTTTIPLRVRSLVGIVPLLAVEILESDTIERLPGFKKRMQWFLDHRKDLPWQATCTGESAGEGGHRLLAIPTRERLVRVLRYLLDETEFLSPFGVRSLSKHHDGSPYVFRWNGQEYRVDYEPGESRTALFGGNSNWRGPIWFPINFLLIEALERYYHFYGDEIEIELPHGSGHMVNLAQAASEIRGRLARLFFPDAHGARPCHGVEERFARDPHWKDLVYFYEHFHGDTGRGLGASHQTGWTALVLHMLHDVPIDAEEARAGEDDQAKRRTAHAGRTIPHGRG
jgi:hypothetical protein